MLCATVLRSLNGFTAVHNTEIFILIISSGLLLLFRGIILLLPFKAYRFYKYWLLFFIRLLLLHWWQGHSLFK